MSRKGSPCLGCRCAWLRQLPPFRPPRAVRAGNPCRVWTSRPSASPSVEIVPGNPCRVWRSRPITPPIVELMPIWRLGRGTISTVDPTKRHDLDTRFTSEGAISTLAPGEGWDLNTRSRQGSGPAPAPVEGNHHPEPEACQLLAQRVRTLRHRGIRLSGRCPNTRQEGARSRHWIHPGGMIPTVGAHIAAPPRQWTTANPPPVGTRRQFP